MRFLALGLLVAACHHSAPQAGTFRSPEDLARHAFESLRAGDEYAWGRALATDAELGELVSQFGTTEKNTLLTRIKEERDQAAAAFRSIRDSVGEWNGATLEKIDAPMGTSGAVDGSDVTIAFVRGETRYLVRLDDCMKAKRGWVIGGTPRVEKR